MHPRVVDESIRRCYGGAGAISEPERARHHRSRLTAAQRALRTKGGIFIPSNYAGTRETPQFAPEDRAIW